MKCEKPRLGFELGSPYPFPTSKENIPFVYRWFTSYFRTNGYTDYPAREYLFMYVQLYFRLVVNGTQLVFEILKSLNMLEVDVVKIFIWFFFDRKTTGRLCFTNQWCKENMDNKYFFKITLFTISRRHNWFLSYSKRPVISSNRLCTQQILIVFMTKFI